MAIDTIGTNAITNDAVTAAKIPAGAVDADLGPVHSVISVKGTIINSVATTLTIEIGGKFASSVDVKYLTSGGTVIATDTGRTVTNGTLTSAVPSAVYSGYSAGNVISIKIVTDSVDSANSIEKTVITAPTGGTITTSGDYRIHTFTSSGSFVVADNTLLRNIEYLVIAGGGGAGYHTANGYYYDSVGGGGAGGYRCSVPGETSGGGVPAEPAIPFLTSGTYECHVGAGGATANASAVGGQAGGHSVFGGNQLETVALYGSGSHHAYYYGTPDRSQNPIQSSTGSLPIMAHGGGGSVSVCWNPPQGTRGGNGGSGGGSGSASGTTATFGYNLTRQGHQSGTLSDVQAGSAGGGAGGAGANINTSNKGTTNNYNGGVGLTSSITGSAVGRGGGGAAGGSASSGHSQTGGTGTSGGGNGGNYQSSSYGKNGNDGDANTGGGGGGSGASGGASAYGSGAGGSGVIILRYKLNEVDNFL